MSRVGADLCELRIACHDETAGSDRPNRVFLQRAELGRTDFDTGSALFECEADDEVCVVRMPYGKDSTGGHPCNIDRAGDEDVDDEGLFRIARLRCYFCRHLFTPAGKSLAVRAMPSGRWDDCIEDMICFDGPTAVPMLARDVNFASAGRCLMGHAEVLLHSRDVIPGAVVLVNDSPSSADGKLPNGGRTERVGGNDREWRSLKCARCNLPVGRPALLLQELNAGDEFGMLLLKHCLLGDDVGTADNACKEDDGVESGTGGNRHAHVGESKEGRVVRRRRDHVFEDRTAIKWLMGEMEYSKEANGCARFIVTAKGRSRSTPAGCLSLLLLKMNTIVSVDGGRKPRRGHRVAFREESLDEAKRADETEVQGVSDSKYVEEGELEGPDKFVQKMATRVHAQVLEVSYGEYRAVKRRLVEAAWASKRTVDIPFAKLDSRGYSNCSYLF